MSRWFCQLPNSEKYVKIELLDSSVKIKIQVVYWKQYTEEQCHPACPQEMVLALYGLNNDFLVKLFLKNKRMTTPIAWTHVHITMCSSCSNHLEGLTLQKDEPACWNFPSGFPSFQRDGYGFISSSIWIFHIIGIDEARMSVCKKCHQRPIWKENPASYN